MTPLVDGEDVGDIEHIAEHAAQQAGIGNHGDQRVDTLDLGVQQVVIGAPPDPGMPWNVEWREQSHRLLTHMWQQVEFRVACR